jgi:protein-S-isoprenylcysteine O-methyltransferase Ste14
MTVAHLIFALAMTAYILTAIMFEERDLTAAHPEYAEYRKRVPMLIPGLNWAYSARTSDAVPSQV